MYIVYVCMYTSMKFGLLFFFLKKVFFVVDHFKRLYGIYYNIASAFMFCFLATKHMGS